MTQIKVSLNDSNADFVSRYRDYGYSSKSAIVADAVSRLREELNRKALLESAELYQEVYQNDIELQKLTDVAAGLCLE